MLIGARNGMLAGGWKNPYPTDGLVGMWISKWNTRGGIFNPNHHGLTNLAQPGVADFAWASNTEGVSWTNDGALLLTNGNKSKVSVANAFLQIPTATTVQIVAKYDWKFTDNYNNLQMPLLWFGTSAPCARFSGVNFDSAPGLSAMSYTNKALYAYLGASYFNGATKTSCSVHGPATQSATEYINGTAYSLQSNYSEFITYTTGSLELTRTPRADVYLYGVRIYSRHLSAAEEAAIYAIDREVFDLP